MNFLNTALTVKLILKRYVFVLKKWNNKLVVKLWVIYLFFLIATACMDVSQLCVIFYARY